MKIDRRNFLLASSAGLLAQSKLSFGSSKPENDHQRLHSVEPFSATGKQVTVYTTADKTDHRISATDTLQLPFDFIRGIRVNLRLILQT
jgi:hypothetical protein